MTSGDKAELLG